jgi:hypothetical protein
MEEITQELDFCVDQIIEVFTKTNEIRNNLTKLLDYEENLLVDCYHLIEAGKFPAHVKSEIMKNLEVCLRRRRTLKFEIQKINTLNSQLREKGVSAKITSPVNAKYYRTRTSKDLFDKYSKYLEVKFI